MLTLLAAGAANGCRVDPPEVSALIHSTLPDPLPDDMLIAEVDFVGDVTTEALHGAGLRAHVRRIIKGRYEGRLLIVRMPGLFTDCDRPTANGTSGLIVVKPVGLENDILVVEPVLVERRHGFRLPAAVSARR
jgi:hypothetical protein